MIRIATRSNFRVRGLWVYGFRVQGLGHIKDWSWLHLRVEGSRVSGCSFGRGALPSKPEGDEHRGSNGFKSGSGGTLFAMPQVHRHHRRKRLPTILLRTLCYRTYISLMRTVSRSWVRGFELLEGLA